MALTYTVGTIALTNGGATVTGTGTSWNGAIVPGWLLRAPDGKVYVVTAVNSNTSITIAPSYEGSTASGQAYVLMASGAINTDLATRLQELITDYATIYNTVGQGKFPDGTLALPGIAFASDADLGARRKASNHGALSAGGADRIEWNSAGAVITGLLSGTAVTQSATDTTAGRLLKAGDFGAGAAAGTYLFGRANILGTVNQSGGVPTGAIIERGSNANGSFVRFADGTQICRHILASGVCATATGSVFRSGVVTWTYPAVFVSNPSVRGETLQFGSLNFSANSVGATAASGVRLSPVSDATTPNIDFLAIGRWF